MRIDAGKSTSTTTTNVTVIRGKTGMLPFKVKEPDPNCEKTAVATTIRLRAKIVKTIRISGVPSNKARSFFFKVALKKGSYTWTVKATDVAGNAGKASAAKKLTVR